LILDDPRNTREDIEAQIKDGVEFVVDEEDKDKDRAPPRLRTLAFRFR
jgi:hypothetical protein